MKNNIKLFRIFVLVIAVLGAGALTQKLYYLVCALRYVSYTFSPTISPAQQQDIKAQVALFKHDGMYNPYCIIDTIKSFSCVKSVSVHCSASHTAHIIVEAYDPIVRINGTHVLTAAKTIIPDRSYAWYVLNNLPSLSMASVLPEHCSDRMMDAVRRCIKEQIFERYTLSWVNEHELYFRDINDPSFSLLCDAVSLPTHALLISCEQVKNSIKRDHSVPKSWVADLRFDDQIIVSRDKGGGYGKGV